MTQDKSYKSLTIDPQLVESSLKEFGIEELKAQEKSVGKHTMFTGVLNGEKFALNLFTNADGRCTLGQASGFSVAAFKSAADFVKKKCSYGSASRLELSISVDEKQPDLVVNYLLENGAVVEEFIPAGPHSQWRIKGPRGDSIVLKFFPTTKTFQAQGPHAHLASLFFDFVCNVLGHEEAINAQRQIYKINLTVAEANNELRTVLPAVHDYLEEVTRKQFSSAYAYTKIGINLEDYSGLVFNALRGLEGFCFQVLSNECNLKPGKGVNLGSYFELCTDGSYRMLPIYSADQNVNIVEMLDAAYSLWNKERHGLFHMDPQIVTTRTIDSREAAVRITYSVFELIDGKFLKYQKSL